MLFKEFGNTTLPTIILLHGGGLSWWSLQKVSELLQSRYHVITPIINGHGEDGEKAFVSIQNSAEKLINYIDKNCEGKVFALAGLSIGAQIVTEVLSTRTDIAQYAIIESALVYPIKGSTAMAVPTYYLLYGLIKQKWFSRIQSKTLCVPEDLFEQYYKDSLNISRQSLINITLSNGNYILKDSIADTGSKVLIIVGEKEINIMKKSACRLHDVISGSELYTVKSMGHGEISLVHPQEYVSLLCEFFSK
ncbi:MAG: alpha/beta fold hydrolase [Acetanaerobacterium sp.]